MRCSIIREIKDDIFKTEQNIRPTTVDDRFTTIFQIQLGSDLSMQSLDTVELKEIKSCQILTLHEVIKNHVRSDDNARHDSLYKFNDEFIRLVLVDFEQFNQPNLR